MCQFRFISCPEIHILNYGCENSYISGKVLHLKIRFLLISKVTMSVEVIFAQWAVFEQMTLLELMMRCRQGYEACARTNIYVTFWCKWKYLRNKGL